MVNLRAGNIGDAAAIAGIFNYWVRTSTVIFSNRELSASMMAERLGTVIDGKYPFLVAIDEEGDVIGYAYAHSYHPDPVYSGTWELTEYLSPGATGNGLGTRLFHALIDECRRCGAHVLISCITSGNAACERMNREAGFTLSGVLPQVGFKFGQWLDDALYTKILD